MLACEIDFSSAIQNHASKYICQPRQSSFSKEMYISLEPVFAKMKFYGFWLLCTFTKANGVRFLKTGPLNFRAFMGLFEDFARVQKKPVYAVCNFWSDLGLKMNPQKMQPMKKTASSGYCTWTVRKWLHMVFCLNPA